MLLFTDGFYHYGDFLSGSDLLQKWDAVEGSGSSYRTAGRISGLAALTLDGLRVRKGLGGVYPELIVGVAVKRVSSPELGYPTAPFLEFWSAGSLQVQIRSASDGALEVATDPNASSALAVSENRMLHGYWYYVEARVYPHPSGSVHLRVDGADWLTASGLNLAPTASGADEVALIDESPGKTQFTDVYVQDPSGSTNNDFLGDSYVLLYLPTGSGAYADWTPSGSEGNWEMVDEQFPDDDATYVAASAASLRDTYAFSQYTAYDLSSASIRGVIAWTWARVDTGSAALQGIALDSGGSLSSATAEQTVSSSAYRYYPLVWEQGDAPDGEWSASTLEQTEFGYERTA